MTAPSLTPAPPDAGPSAAPGTAPTPVQSVVGDGTTARSRSTARWRRARWPLGVVALLVVTAVVLALSRPVTSGTPLAPDNPGPEGARALAQVLGRQGVDVRYVQTVAAAVAAAPEGTTLFIADNGLLLPEQVDALVATEADLVLLEPSGDLLDAATDGQASLGYAWPDDAARAASCDDPDARAAERIGSDGLGFLATGADTTLCFPSPDDDDTGAYLVYDDGNRQVRAIDSRSVVLNESVSHDGNTALALRALGHRERLVWLVPSPTDTSATGNGPALPPWAGVVGLQLLLVAVVTVVWRARRLGPLVTEDLPVIVRASETTRGRGRLYRRAHARGHAAAGLRASAADRLAPRLGLARSVSGPVLVDAVVRATGRPAEQIAHLLYGPPPADDAALLALALHLDQIESEVYHP